MDTADEVGLTKAYQKFQLEAQNVEPEYAPKTVNTDGWQATQLAWLALFPLTALLRCFPHAWLSIRDRCKKDKEFHAAGDKIWEAVRGP